MVALDGDVTASDYDSDSATSRHAATTIDVLAAATATVLGVGLGGEPAAAAGAGAAVGFARLLAGNVSRRTGIVATVCVALAVVGALRSGQAWEAVEPDLLGPFGGWVEVVDDPQPRVSSTRVIIAVQGERYELWSRRTGEQRRIESWRAGEWVELSGVRHELEPQRARRVAWQHVVGEFRADWVGDRRAGAALARASNRVRAAIERAGNSLPGDDGTLFRGLVVGDDRDQPWEMIDRFRRSGLSHLTAVSGQNVSFLLAASGPLLRRLQPWPRLFVSVALIGWFVALTRFEPSIVRAGVMAALSATAFVLGRQRGPVRILGVAVLGLVLVDPLLVWSVGFWLSVGATFGVSAFGPWLARRLAPLDPTGLFALPLGVTLGAQLGVIVPSLLVFGRLPLVSIPANLLAVPVAGAVMLYGLPAGLLAGWVPWTAPVVMFPARVGVRWVDTVAVLGARLEPDPPAQLVGWGMLGVVVVAALVAARSRAVRIGAGAVHPEPGTRRQRRVRREPW